MFHIGHHCLTGRVLLAPMAGISDTPFRAICQGMGAALTTSEMITADTRLWHSRKSRLRLLEETASDSEQIIPRSIQIAGSEPEMMASAAIACAEQGAEIIDINMGCPAKKVCSKAAGSALLRDEDLVTNILRAVVKAVEIPVSLKIRTGWCPQSRNATTIAKIAEDAGIQALTVHGRTRACHFKGEAEYQTIADIVNTVSIPVIANGDITSPEKAERVLKETGAAAVMIGRAAQGQPWMIKMIDDYLKTGLQSEMPALEEIQLIVEQHLSALHEFYGDYLGPRIARKHIKWYLQNLPLTKPTDSEYHRESIKKTTVKFQQQINSTESTSTQHALVQELFERLITREDIAA
ncbi:tRNA dihydrouridine synthase DusB [Aurantivibrio infirmus]